MKKLINDARSVVREMLEGIADCNPELALLDTENVALLAGIPENPADRPVAIISGGGAGHEPAHAGYVGKGLLTAAVTGDVFTSPSVDAVLSAIRACAGPLGAVLIVKNYTGDRLNFGLAAELAQVEGIPVEVVVVADDVALGDLVPPERRRGIAGTIFIHKIAGAAAVAGKPLAEVALLARDAASRLGTMGLGLGTCTVPAAKRPGFSLGENEIELGLGIHGEKGVERTEIQSADVLSERLLTQIKDDIPVQSGDRVALLVNGLGATPPMELAIVARHALSSLRGAGIIVERAWTGNFLTALEMPGCSISLLRLKEADLPLLSAPTSAPAWQGTGAIPLERAIVAAPPVPPESYPTAGDSAEAQKLRAIALHVADALEQAEPHLTDLDSKAGDGDLGVSMMRGAAAIKAEPNGAWSDAATALLSTANALRKAIGGSSGPFYAVALTRAGRFLETCETIDGGAIAKAFRIAVEAISEIGGAKPNDRTMLDALHPALLALEAARKQGLDGKAAWRKAADAAEAGAQATASMSPKLGRASYLGERAVGAPDGGAAAVAIWMKAIGEKL